MNAVVLLASSNTHLPIKVLYENGVKQSFILNTVTFLIKSQIGDMQMKRMELGLVKS